jgi:hypothetical protein
LPAPAGARAGPSDGAAGGASAAVEHQDLARLPDLVACGVAWTAVAGLLGSRFAGRAADDVYITYRYAQNLAAGHGFVFNPGERVFGVTDPGVGLLLGGLTAATGIPIPVLGTLLTGLAVVCICLLLAADAPTRGARRAALAAGTLTVASPMVWLSQGAGPILALAALLASARLARGSLVASGIAAGAAAWFRPDALVGATLLGVLLLRRRGPRAIPFLAGSGAVVLAGLALAAWWFGRALPETLEAKRQFAALRPELFTGFHGFWGRAWDLFRAVQGAEVAGPVVVLAVAGLVAHAASARWRRESGPLLGILLAYSCLLVGVYTWAQVPFFVWYVVPVVIGIFHSAASALRGAIGRLAPRRRWAGVALMGVALAALGGPLLHASLRWWQGGNAGDWRHEAYRAVGAWLRDNTDPREDVAFDEIGIVAFTSQRPVRDLIGLVSRESRPFAARGDQVGAFLARPARSVVVHTFTRRGGTRPIVSRPWFRAAYEEVARLPFPRFGAHASIYRLRDARAIPPPRAPRPARARR